MPVAAGRRWRSCGPLGRSALREAWVEEFDKMIDEARFTFDFDKRRQLLEKTLKVVVDDAPWLFLWQPTSLAAARSDVKGFVPRADGYLFLNKVTKG